MASNDIPGRPANNELAGHKSAYNELVFNIVFTPGTVRYLRLATLSLLEFSPYRYRLVANGLQPAELRQLKQFCQGDPRLEYFAYPTSSMLFHSTLLTLLERRENSEFFCFADSDIFATEPFHDELSASLTNCDVFSSGGRIGFSDEERQAGIAGPVVETDGGLPLATSFFAVYRRQPLEQIIAQTGISFERFTCREQIPGEVLEWLQGQGIEQEKFDTGKLMNILGQRIGMRIRYKDLNALHHIGGLTQGFMYLDSSASRRGMPWQRWFQRRAANDHTQGIPNSLVGPQRRRIEVGYFFAAYLQALFDDQDLPAVPGSISVDNRIQRTCEVISRLYAQHHDRLND